MNKLKAALALFVFSTLVGGGVSLLIVEDACACICEGPYDIELSCDTGPNCTNPSFPYYKYNHGIDDCEPPKPCSLFGGCHNGVKAGC